MPRPTRGLPSLLGLAALALAHLLPLRGADAKLVRPAIPPRGMNSFDIQFARRDPNTTVPVWNESEFRRLATAMASQAPLFDQPTHPSSFPCSSNDLASRLELSLCCLRCALKCLPRKI